MVHLLTRLLGIVVLTIAVMDLMAPMAAIAVKKKSMREKTSSGLLKRLPQIPRMVTSQRACLRTSAASIL